MKASSSTSLPSPSFGAVRLRAAVVSVVLAGLASPAAAQENPPVPSVCNLRGGDTASTCLFTANAAGLPVSARTDWPEDFDTPANNADPLNTAEHELLHAIGFTTAYARFAARLIATPGAGAGGIPAGSRSYSTNGQASGILMVITPEGTHADPAATGAAPWPATGYDQAGDIMQPSQVLQTRLNPLDALVLDQAFDWLASGIHIDIDPVGGTLDAADLTILHNAVAAVNAFYPDRTGSPVFTWHVAEVALVPEPATWLCMAVGMGLLGAVVRRRPSPAAVA